MGGVGSGRKPREYPPELVELVCGMYRDGMTVAEIRAAAPRGYRVQTILERYLPERRPKAKRDQAGERNHMWSGDDCGYQAAHLRLGKAAERACVDCGEDAHDWSYAYGCQAERRSSRDVPYCTHWEHYSPRCRTCHRRYDRSAKVAKA